MHVLHVPTVDARRYIQEKNYILRYVRTYCAYCCFYWRTYVPTVRTALTNAISTNLLNKTAVSTVHYRCTYFLQVLTDDVRTLRKESRDLRVKKLAGDDTVIEAVTTPTRAKPGENLPSVRSGWLFSLRWKTWPTCV